MQTRLLLDFWMGLVNKAVMVGSARLRAVVVLTLTVLDSTAATPLSSVAALYWIRAFWFVKRFEIVSAFCTGNGDGKNA